MVSAVFSPCRTWRYTLTRQIGWEACADGCRADAGAGLHKEECKTRLRTVAFIGLNPSTADETTDDPTVRRCVGFARSWGYDRMVMLNLFAYRSTDPKVLRSLTRDEAVGPDNDRQLCLGVLDADLTVACWGTHGVEHGREDEVFDLLVRSGRQRLHTFGLTKGGHPKHPLYLRGDLRPVAWGAPPSPLR